MSAWRCASTLPRLSNGLARAVRRLRELPLATRLAHDEIHAVLRLALGRPARRCGKRQCRAVVSEENERLSACLS